MPIKSYNPFAWLLWSTMLDKVKARRKRLVNQQVKADLKRKQLKEDYDDAIARLDLQRIERSHAFNALDAQEAYLCERGDAKGGPVPVSK